MRPFVFLRVFWGESVKTKEVKHIGGRWQVAVGYGMDIECWVLSRKPVTAVLGTSRLELAPGMYLYIRI